MKPKFDKISVISILIILFLISIPGFYVYYFQDWRTNEFSQDVAQRKAIPEFQEESRIYNERVVLRKDKSFTFNNSRLVFKGLKDKMIHLDVFLLDLDPEYAYPHYISKADATAGVRLGDSKFQLLKVNKKILQLKIFDLYNTY